MPTGIYERTKPNSGMFKRGEHHSPSTEIQKGQHLNPDTEFKRDSPNLLKAIANRAYMYQDSEWLHKQSESHSGQHYSPETEIKRGQRLSPETEFKPLIPGGVSSEEMKIRASGEYVAWRKAVYERDDYTCQICGQRGRKLEAHHKKPFATHPELRLELSNGITLCKLCHRKGVMPNAVDNRNLQAD